jgi:uncharacterized small protein (DUF1192 family)
MRDLLHETWNSAAEKRMLDEEMGWHVEIRRRKPEETIRLLSERCSVLMAEVERLKAALIQKDHAEAEAMALVLSHEGHIAKMESEIERLKAALDEQAKRIAELHAGCEERERQLRSKVTGDAALIQTLLDDKRRLLAALGKVQP